MKLFQPTDKKNFWPMLRSEMIQYKLNKTPLWNILKRNRLTKKLLGSIDGTAYTIYGPFRVAYGKNIFVGKNFFANWNCMILDHAEVHTGDNVMLGPNVTLSTVTHPKDAAQRAIKPMKNSIGPNGRGNIELVAPINIGNNVWIATGAIICPGVTIGDNSIIGAGSVVTRGIPANVFACGVPCKVIREITEKDSLTFENNFV